MLDSDGSLRPLTSYTDKELSRMIGIVLTEKPDVRNMTVEDLVGMGRSPYTGFWGTLSADDKQIVADAIRMVGIEPLRGRMIHTLSDGERQKVMIAKALAQPSTFLYELINNGLRFATPAEVSTLNGGGDGNRIAFPCIRGFRW